MKWFRAQWQRFNLRRRWHQLVLGRTAEPAGILRGIGVEYNSCQQYGLQYGMKYQIEFMPTATMVVGMDTVLVKRTALDVQPGVLRIVLETCE